MNSKSVALSINPTYLCNFRCTACYLTPQQLSDSKVLELDRLSDMLAHVCANATISHVDLYGGEIGTLSIKYQIELYFAIRHHYSGQINVVTNFLRPIYITKFDGVDLSVSYDFEHRERHEQVWDNIVRSTKDMNVLVLATPEVMRGDVDEMISKLNSVHRVVSVEVKPYSPNQANQHASCHLDYEEFVKRWISSPVKKNFAFTNEREIKSAIAKTRNAFSDDHLYITPSGEFAVLDFDLNDNEFFKPVVNFSEYSEWCNKEKTSVKTNTYCSQCEYVGSCLSEHLRIVKDVSKSCNGYYNLIKWYDNGRVENTSTHLS